MSSKNTFPPPKRDVKPPFPYKNSLYNGALMTIGILGSTYAVKHCFGKKYAPDISTNQLVTLGIVTVLSRFGIDYIKREKLVSLEM